MTGLNKEFYQALNQLDLFQEIPEELRERVGQVLQKRPLSPFRRDPTMKEIRAAYKQDANGLVLAEQLDAFFVEHDLYRDVMERTVLEEITEEDLQLAYYEVLVG